LGREEEKGTTKNMDLTSWGLVGGRRISVMGTFIESVIAMTEGKEKGVGSTERGQRKN